MNFLYSCKFGPIPTANILVSQYRTNFGLRFQLMNLRMKFLSSSNLILFHKSKSIQLQFTICCKNLNHTIIQYNTGPSLSHYKLPIHDLVDFGQILVQYWNDGITKWRYRHLQTEFNFKSFIFWSTSIDNWQKLTNYVIQFPMQLIAGPRLAQSKLPIPNFIDVRPILVQDCNKRISK